MFESFYSSFFTLGYPRVTVEVPRVETLFYTRPEVTMTRENCLTRIRLVFYG